MKISVQDPKDPNHKSQVYTEENGEFIRENDILYLKIPYSHCIMALKIERFALVDNFTHREVGYILEP
ncbi:hypothetical protein B1207_07525 [Legionella quinlivanii]|uniref:Uncharacterized protein n=1 Tax=Legionella quinlivanii TaxID=45073 RepID=A0A364LJG7_9GAMM|nr:hypothetical protein [Legionella quinlivanii]RAP36646.1 hypothetical protein B1207_07525 [Legionella quinlivanii]